MTSPSLSHSTPTEDVTHSIQRNPLDVLSMKLKGVHLIEASAGTGKTYNITQIALRLLLSKRAKITEILIVTFTVAATQEIRSRISSAINDCITAIKRKDALTQLNPVMVQAIAQFQHDGTAIDESAARHHALNTLQLAALELDEAPIFTIHAFCHQLIKRVAFQTNQPFAYDVVNDVDDIALAVTEDYFRKFGKESAFYAALDMNNIKSPTDFVKAYSKPLTSHLPIHSKLGQALIKQAQDRVDEAHALSAAKDFYDFIQHTLPEYHSVLGAAGLKIEANQLGNFMRWYESPSLHNSTFSVNRASSAKVINALGLAENEAKDLVTLRKAFDLSMAYKNMKSFVKEQQKYLNSALHIEHIEAAINAIRHSIITQKARLNTIQHDDAVRLLAQSITTIPHLSQQITAQYPVALIDEFQDTDVEQYRIFSTLYPKGTERLLLMIGDPKQAIYSFRGGDIATYLEAASKVNYSWSMQHNFRSSRRMIEAYNHLFYGAIGQENRLAVLMQRLSESDRERELGGGRLKNETLPSVEAPIIGNSSFGETITYPWIYAGKESQGLMALTTKPACIEFNLLENQYASEQPNKSAPLNKEEHANYMANQIVQLLQKGRLSDTEPSNENTKINRDDAYVQSSQRKVVPSDIAILVRTKTDAEIVKKALKRANLQAVFLGDKSNIFDSDEALQLMQLMQAMLNIYQHPKVMLASASQLLGYSFAQMAELATRETKLYDMLLQRLAELNAIWEKSGIYAVIQHCLKHYFRPVSRVSRDRELTNFLQLAEILQQESKRILQTEALAKWFIEHVSMVKNSDELNENSEAYAMRLESDAELIKIVTMHGSKGLEYPIVFVPFAGFYSPPPSKRFLQYHDGQHQQIALSFDQNAKCLADKQSDDESVRLLYVAITRAQYYCCLGVASAKGFLPSALARLLNIQQSETEHCNTLSQLQQLEVNNPSHFKINYIPAEQVQEQYRSSPVTKTLAANTFLGRTDMQWELQSFSKITKAHRFVEQYKSQDSEEEYVKHDKPTASDPYRFTILRSSLTGDLLHQILEDHNFNQPLDISQHQRALKAFENATSQSVDQEQLHHWIAEVLATPIFEWHSQSTFTLSQLSQTLKEPEFYFPLHAFDVNNLVEILGEHRAAELKQLSKTDIEGMMTGFIDLLFCYQGRYYVADYKSNYLGNQFSHYAQNHMQQTIEMHDYDLQYLLYSWVLHRYLSYRVNDYEFDTHFGGVYYFFLRGMQPKVSNEGQCGIYGKQITAQDIELLDHAFLNGAEKRQGER